MNDLRFTLTTDGSSDRVLLRHLGWMLRRRLGPQVALQPQWADLRQLRSKPKKLAERIRFALELYPADLLFVHRDAESIDPSPRYAEIEQAAAEANADVPVVPVVPIRMTEAWLLFDERAVRWAAGNPNGRQALGLSIKNVEANPDPKSLLREAIKTASGKTGRRLRKLAQVDQL